MVDGQHQAPDVLPPGKTRYPWEVEWALGQVRTGVENLPPPLGFDLRTFQPVANRYTAWAIPGHWKASISCVMSWMSVRPSAKNNSARMGRIFMKLDTWEFAKYLSKNFNFHSSLTGITATLFEDLCTFLIISRSFLFRMRNFSDNSFRENQNKRFMFNNFFPKIVIFIR